MFSSSGFFRGVTCPYFSSGLCERPYCHFRHIKTDDSQHAGHGGSHKSHYGEELEAAISPSDGPQHKPSMLSIMGQAIRQVQEFDRLKSQAPQYKPTPIAGRRSSNHASRKYLVHAPEYKPTPIKVLKKAPVSRPQNAPEYDPVVNFSSTKEPSRQLMTHSRVTLGDGGKETAIKRQHSTEPSSSEVCAKKLKPSVSSSHLETDAKFSDDEDNELSMDCRNADNSKQINSEATNGTSYKPAIQPDSSDSSQSLKTTDRENIFEKLSSAGASSKTDICDHNSESQNSTKSKRERKGSTSAGPDKPAASQEEAETEKEKENHPGQNNHAENSARERHDKSKHESHSHSSRHRHSSKKSDHSDASGKRSSTRKGSSENSDDKSKSSSHKHQDSRKHHSSGNNHKGKDHSSDKDHKRKHSSGDKDKSKHHSTDKHKHSHSSHDKHKGDHHHSSERSSKDKSSSSHRHSKHSSHKSSSSNSTSSKSKHHHHHSKHSGHSSTKSSPSKRKQRTTSVSHSDLFGDDSDTGVVIKSTNGIAKTNTEHSSDSDVDSVELMDELELDLSEEDVYDECLRLYKDEDKRCREKKSRDLKVSKMESRHSDNDEDAAVTVGKKRTAHPGAEDGVVKRKPPPKPNCRLTPAQVMQNRLIEMQKHMQKQSESNKNKSPEATLGGKSRVAHTAGSGIGKNKNSLLNRRPSGASSSTCNEEDSNTPCQTATKTGKRVAHIPKKATLRRPTIVADVGSKIPTNVRQRYLNTFIEECLKIYTEEQDAFERGAAEEKGVYERSSSKSIYLNVAVNTVKKLRDETTHAGAAEKEQKLGSPKNTKALSHQAVLGGARAATTSFTVRRSGGPVKPLGTFTGKDLYNALRRYILTEEQLVDNGFPRPSPDQPNFAVIKSPHSKPTSKLQSSSNERVCCRCGSRFEILPNGKHVKQETCSYHWGKCWKRRVAGSIENMYTCCQGDLGTKGCQIAKYHVHDENKGKSSAGYVKTIPLTSTDDEDFTIYSLDCEMVYTTHGIELARITVIDTDLKPVYEKLVQPQHKVLDCNTRFSGLTEDDLKGVKTTIRDVQAVLLSLFTSQTILIGHSLESDLIALKVIHDTVVDTSVVFPHRLGPPYKRALRTLMGEILQKIIQNDVGGHDSQEDAAACMELMLWKVKDDARKAGRRS